MDGMQHLLSAPTGLAIGKVTDVNDSQSRGRVKVSLAATGMEVWAPCVVPSAGQSGGTNYGVSFLPKVDEIVLVAFLTPDQPFILGAVWSGQNSLPSDAVPAGQRYAVVTQSETKMVFDDSAPSFTVTTKHGNEIALTDADDKCTITVGATTIEATTTGVTITTSASVELKTSSLTVTASSVTVNAGISKFSGIVQCDTLITNSVVSASYTPGAGNIW